MVKRTEFRTGVSQNRGPVLDVSLGEAEANVGGGESNRMACPTLLMPLRAELEARIRRNLRKRLLRSMPIDGAESIDLIMEFISLGNEISPPSLE